MNNIPNLDEVVLEALDFFITNPPPPFDVNRYDLPFVVGSGNAYNTGTILFSDKAAVFADESNFKKILPSFRKVIDSGLISQAIVLSASGGKDSVWELEFAKQNGLKTTLLTTKQESDAAKVADEVFAFKSISEPYTYNTSTYMGMILASTKENASNIRKELEKLEFPPNFNDYEAYSFVLPDKFLNICPMLDIKKSELFGPKLSLRAFSQGHARHAKFVIRDPKELVISLSSENNYFGEDQSRWEINTLGEVDFAGVMAITYYIVGKIQSSKPPHFKENIGKYVQDYGPKAYGKNEPFDLIVPGSA